MQLDGSGRTLRSFELKQPNGVPVQPAGLVVDTDFILAAGVLRGTFEFVKPH